MERLDSHEITPHLEAALMMAPPDTLEALGCADRYRRNRAVSRLAEHLVSRLNCFDIVMTDKVLLEELEDTVSEMVLNDEAAFALGEVPVTDKKQPTVRPPVHVGPPKLSVCK